MTITIQTPKGNAIHITLSHHHSGIALDCEIPTLTLKVRAFAVYPLKAPKQGATHYLDAYQHSIGLDDANAQLVRDAIAAYQAAYQQSPSLTENGGFCSCPDYAFRATCCKHQVATAVRVLQDGVTIPDAPAPNLTLKTMSRTFDTSMI